VGPPCCSGPAHSSWWRRRTGTPPTGRPSCCTACRAWAARQCDPDVESPLESAGRHAFLRAGLPPSPSNVWVGEYVPEARLDHYWPEFRVAAEGDGIGKYLINDPAAAIRKEKGREWLLPQRGIRVVRYTWAVATRSPDVLAGRLGVPLRSAAPG
jgi:hypothetical protein